MTIDHVELYVKAGQDGESNGGCPVCQQYFMILLTKSKFDYLTFRATTVNTAKPPEELKQASNRLPTLIHGDNVISDPDELLQYVNEKFPKPAMAYDNRDAVKATQNVFSKFSFFIKDVASNSDALLLELQRLDNYLKKDGHVFLSRDVPDHLDCVFLPKLHHVRVVSHAIKNFTIPAELSHLWKYLDNAYNIDIFNRSCPSDQEIVAHWLSKSQVAPLPKDKREMYKVGVSKPRYSFDVPPQC